MSISSSRIRDARWVLLLSVSVCFVFSPGMLGAQEEDGLGTILEVPIPELNASIEVPEVAVTRFDEVSAVFFGQIGHTVELRVSKEEIAVPAEGEDAAAMWDAQTTGASKVTLLESGVSPNGLRYLIFTHQVKEAGSSAANSKGRHKTRIRRYTGIYSVVRLDESSALMCDVSMARDVERSGNGLADVQWAVDICKSLEHVAP